MIKSVSDIVEKMYQLFVLKDLDLVEINPLGVSSQGELMALDGKVTVNDRAIARHPDITLMAEKKANRATTQYPAGTLGSWEEVEHSGNIAILGNGAGLVMATLDLVTDAGSKPATCLNVGHGRNLNTSPLAFCDRLEQGLNFIYQNKNIRVVLVNIVGSIPTATEIAQVIANFVQKNERAIASKPRSPNYPRLIVRLTGSELDTAREQLTALAVPLVENLDEAVEQTVRLAKVNPAKR